MNWHDVAHGRPQEGGKGALALLPRIWKKMTSYAAVLQNTLKFSLAPSALAINTLCFTLKRRKKRKSFRLRLRRAENGHFFARRAENVLTFLSVGGFAPLWKNFCGRPWSRADEVWAPPITFFLKAFFICKALCILFQCSVSDKSVKIDVQKSQTIATSDFLPKAWSMRYVCGQTIHTSDTTAIFSTFLQSSTPLGTRRLTYALAT